MRTWLDWLTLQRVRLSGSVPSPSGPPPGAEAPGSAAMSLRLPAAVRERLVEVAGATGQSVHAVTVQLLSAATAPDPLALQAELMVERTRTLLRAHRLDVTGTQALLPELTPDVHLSAEALARALTPALIAKEAATFGVSVHWLSGHDCSSAPSAWYDCPGEPVALASASTSQPVQDVTYHWLATAGASWLHTPPPEDSAGLKGWQLSAETAQHQLALVATISRATAPHRVYRLWRPESIDYTKARIIARIIATRLHARGAAQYGALVAPEVMVGLAQGSLIAADALAERRVGAWPVADVLLLGQGVYRDEDQLIGDGYLWAGAADVPALQAGAR